MFQFHFGNTHSLLLAEDLLTFTDVGFICLHYLDCPVVSESTLQDFLYHCSSWSCIFFLTSVFSSPSCFGEWWVFCVYFHISLLFFFMQVNKAYAHESLGVNIKFVIARIVLLNKEQVTNYSPFRM